MPSRLREGWVGIQHPSGEVRAPTKPKAKYNKIGKIRKADFHLNVSRSETYRATVISCAPRLREVTERNTFALAKVLTPSKIPKRSFVILKRGGET